MPQLPQWFAEDFNAKAFDYDDPLFSVPIDDFPDALLIKPEIMDGKLIKQFTIYQHPEFKRFDRRWGWIDWVVVSNGNIIGPAFEQLNCVKILKNTLLAL